MEDKNIGIRVFSGILIIYGGFNLLGLVNYNDFKELCYGIPPLIVILIYIFSVIYSIICIKCGHSMLKFENWARKTAVFFVIASLMVGVFVTPIMTKNLSSVYSKKGVSKKMNVDEAVKSALFFSLLFTFYEMAFVFYFTRVKVKEKFVR